MFLIFYSALLSVQAALEHPWFVAALGGMSIYRVCHVKSSLTRCICVTCTIVCISLLTHTYIHIHYLSVSLPLRLCVSFSLPLRFISYNKLRRTALQFLAEQLSDADIVRLRAALNRADTNMDGKTDAWILDKDRDGKWDVSYWDTDFDGKPDLIGHHPNGALKPASVEKYRPPAAKP